MKLISKKESLKQSIPLISLMCALNIVLSVVATYLPITGIFIFLFLPLISTLLSLNIKYRYYPIYFICSLGLSLLVTMGDISYTLLFLFPSLIIGFILSIFINKKLDYYLAFIITSLIIFLINLGLIPLLDFIFATNTISIFLKIFNLSNNETITIFIPSIIYLISAIQMFIVLIITINEVKKLGYIFIFRNIDNLLLSIISIISDWICIGFLFFNLKISYIFLFISLVISILMILELYRDKSKIPFILSLITIPLGWLIYIICINNMSLESSFISLVSIPSLISLISIFVYFFNEYKLKNNLIK